MWRFLRNRRLILRLHTIFRALIYRASVGIAGWLGVQPPVHFFNPPSLIYSFVLGGSENNPPDCTCIHCLCHHSTSTISVSSFVKDTVPTMWQKWYSVFFEKDSPVFDERGACALCHGILAQWPVLVCFYER